MEPINQEHEINYFTGHPLLTSEVLKLLDQVSDKVFFCADVIENKCLYLGSSAQNVLGYSAEFLKSEGLNFFASIIHPEDYQHTLKVYAKALSEIKSRLDHQKFSYGKSVEFRVKSGSGCWIPIEVNFVLVKSNLERKEGNLFGTIRDLSNRPNNQSSPGDSPELTESSGYKAKKAKSRGHQMDSHQFRSEMLEIGLQNQPLPPITNREKEVLQMIAYGYSSKQVAEALFISPFTVTNHRKHLMSKFKVRNTAELIKVASKYFWM